MKPTVHVLVTGRSEAALPNCRLVFKTIRTGFPTFDIVVRDNDSLPEFVGELRKLCEAVGARYYHQPRGEHGAFIAEIVSKADGPVIFVDTDMVFWQSCEGFTFPAGTLYAGRRLDAMDECGARMAARVHPSFLWIPDPPALRNAIASHPAQRLGYVRPFHGVTLMEGERLVCHDTCATLYALLPERAYAFTERELDCYDHIFCGTLVDTLDQMRMGDAGQGLIREASGLATGDLSKLKGLWRAQESFQGDGARRTAFVLWHYLSGLLRSKAGKEFGLSVSYLAQPGKKRVAHVGVLDVASGRHVSQVIPTDDPLHIRGALALDITLSAGAETDHGIEARPGGWTRHSSAPYARATCTLTVDGETHELVGSVWLDKEAGRITPGLGWAWAALTLEDTRRLMVYDFGQTGRWAIWDDGECVARGTDARLLRCGSGRWSLLAGQIRYDLEPYAPDQTIYANVMTYTEALCRVFEGEREVGHAYLEVLPDGWGKPKLPPEGLMHKRWAAGNPDATMLMSMLGKASQIADDLSDGDVAPDLRSKAVSDLLDTLLFGVAANPFYRQHADTIAPFLKRALHWWHASNVWATDQKLETRMFGYVHREAMADVLWWISFLAGGEERAQSTVFEIHNYYHGQDGGVESFSQWDREPKVRSSRYGQ